MGFVCLTTTKSDFQIQVSDKDNQRNNNNNHLLSLNNMGISQMIDGIGNYAEPKFRSTVFFSKFRSREMDTIFADNVGFKICLYCELSLKNVGLNSFLSRKTNTVLNVATVFVDSYLYETDCVIDYNSTIAETKMLMSVFFTFLFDGNFTGTDYIYNMLSLVDNIRTSLNDAFLYGLLCIYIVQQQLKKDIWLTISECL